MADKSFPQATFAAGCFWGVEQQFMRLPGVVKTTVGYTQGHTKSPAYAEVCSGKTGHTEAVLVQYNPREISYEKLLDAFWGRQDPSRLTHLDKSSNYRSGIYFHTPEQGRLANESLKQKEISSGRKIMLEVLPATAFYPAEEYHQQYFAKTERYRMRR